MSEIGIDLGTTNSLASYFDGEKPVLVRNPLGDFLTPSAVSIADDGSILTGKPALDRLLSHPDRSAANFKRLMGTEQVTRLAGKYSLRAEELSALILKALKTDVEAELERTLEEAVISVPAYFNERQRQATMDAAKLAGINVTRLVNEPTAAALAHGLRESEEGKFLIFDLGGGTFDVSILDKYEGVMEVIATTGDTRLGGNDFTCALENLIVRKALAGIVPGGKAKIALGRQAEIMKSALSRENTANFSFSISGKKFEGEVSRAEFEAECAGLLTRLRIPTERAVRDSKVHPDDFKAIILVGGATRMPMIRSMAARLFGRLPLVSVDPDTTVALGAAVQAGLIRRRGALRDIVMTDVCPFSLGVATVDDAEAKIPMLSVSTIIERNAIVPISRNLVVSTIKDYQTTLEVEVYQGESLRPRGNVKLGSLNVALPRAKKGVESIDIRFTYDSNSILQVEVKVLSTDVVYRQFMNNAAGIPSKEIEERFQALEKLKVHPRELAENSALIARAERLYEESEVDTREFIHSLLKQFENEMLNQQLRDAEFRRMEFARALDSIELSMNRLF